MEERPKHGLKLSLTVTPPKHNIWRNMYIVLDPKQTSSQLGRRGEAQDSVVGAPTRPEQGNRERCIGTDQ
jgi:hypothetical protein